MTRYILAISAALLLSPFVICSSVAAQEAVPPAPQIQAAPEHSAAFDAAMKLYRQRRFPQAIEALSGVVQSEPQNAAAHYFQGYAHYVLRHFTEAQAAFEAAFKVDPSFDPRPYF